MDDLDDTYRRACHGYQLVYGMRVPTFQNRYTTQQILWADFGLASDLRNADLPLREIEQLTGIYPKVLYQRWRRWFPELVDIKKVGSGRRHGHPHLTEIEAALASGMSKKDIMLKFSLTFSQYSGIRFRWRMKQKEQLIVQPT